MDQEATDSESFEICECGDEERSLAGPRCFEVLRTLVKGGEVAWVCVDDRCSSVPAMLQCGGLQSGVSVRVCSRGGQSRERERRCREGKERRHDTRAHGKQRGEWRHMACFSVRQLLFSLVRCRVCFASQHRDAFGVLCRRV